MWRSIVAVAGGALLSLLPACRSPSPAARLDEPPGEDDQWERRMEMIREIEADARATREYTGKTRFEPRVMDAMRQVPRHEFVPAGLRDKAYRNHPLPIGEGQTISQPYIVALMTDLLELSAGDVVLEVGTGSGYQAAVLAELAEQVYSVEIVAPLGLAAAERLAQLGYHNVETRIGDGYHGWEEHAPFDAIIVTAAVDEIPAPLIEQLEPGGRMVVPVASGLMGEQLTVLTKSASGEVHIQEVLPVRFVPLTGDH